VIRRPRAIRQAEPRPQERMVHPGNLPRPGEFGQAGLPGEARPGYNPSPGGGLVRPGLTTDG
jgi:hypothetical protein